MRRRAAVVPLLAAAAVVTAGCGTHYIDVRSNESAAVSGGAQLFYTHCGACHTLSAAGQQGSASRVNSREYKDGPNFDQRKEERDQVLYAIRNGGFSSGPMPQNIVVGKEAEDVAAFVAKYSGGEVARAPTPNQANPQGVPGGENPVQTGGG